MVWITPILEVGLHFVLNYILHSCDAVALTRSVHRQTDV